MTRKQLVDLIFAKQSYLCVGLDTDSTKIPKHLGSDASAVLEFNKAVIDATREYCVAYKINTAFYEALGVKGWEVMEKTVRYIGTDHFTIADAKRGDIGNTAEQYARAFFETLPFDAITIAPYMGEDSVKPFLQTPGKWGIVLGLTSNAGAADFELQSMLSLTEALEEGVHIRHESIKPLYEMVMKKVSTWGDSGNLMFVVGATQADSFLNIRAITPDHFYLVPGVGAQGGSLEEISQKAMHRECGILVNVSRSVIYASAGEDYAKEAGRAAHEYQHEMSRYLSRYGK